MRAAVWKDTGILQVCEVPTPTAGPGEVLLKVISAGVCVTDLHVYTGKIRYGRPPHILGHEIAGLVVALGPGTDTAWLGRRAVVETSVGCGHCPACRRGDRHLCPGMTEIGFTPHPGGYAQYVCVPQGNLVEIPDGVSFDEAGILESVVCPAGSLMRLGVGFGETVAVLGVGPAGLAYIQTARLLGAARVIAVARNDDSLERARRFGADAVVNTRTGDAAAALRELTNGQGPSLVIEAAGAPQTVALAFDIVGVGGRVILYGIPGQEQKLEFPVQQIILRQLSVYGTVGNPHVWRPLLDYVRRGRLNLRDMVTHTFALEDIDAAFAAIQDRTRPIVKAVVHPWEGETA